MLVIRARGPHDYSCLRVLPRSYLLSVSLKGAIPKPSCDKKPSVAAEGGPQFTLL